MPRARCEFTGCNRYARPGLTRCTNHRHSIDRHGKPKGPLERELSEKDYGKYRPMVLQAAADSEGIEHEIGVLRTVLARLIDEEDDPSKLAAGVAKLSGTIIQAMRAQRTLSGDAANEFTDALSLILEEIK